jgi:hypothetical protein
MEKNEAVQRVNTIDIPIQVTLPFVVEIAETEELKPYIYDVYLNGEECLTDSVKPFLSKQIKDSLFYLYEKERNEQERTLNSTLDKA